jgi:hypothetical protein
VSLFAPAAMQAVEKLECLVLRRDNIHRNLSELLSSHCERLVVIWWQMIIGLKLEMFFGGLSLAHQAKRDNWSSRICTRAVNSNISVGEILYRDYR